MRVWIACWLSCISINIQAQTFEAEEGILAGTQVESQRPGYTGSGYVTGFDMDNDKVTMNVDVINAGVYELFIRYAGPYGEKFNFVFVNDLNLGSVQFLETMTFKETLIGKMFLEEGSNSISVVKEWGFFELDNIRLAPAQRSPINPVADILVTKNPSPEASSLYTFLKKTYGKAILSGQYGGTTELNRIESLSGKLPLIRGFDLIDYSPTRVQFGAASSETENAISWNERRGVVTMSWHWNAPKDLINEPDKEWWRGFYTYATTFDVTKAMNDESSEEYELILHDIDVIAVQLKKLQGANVPVIWRPLHEAEGAWFWWGAKGPEPCKWLWRLLFSRLVDHHNIHNLIWVWTSTATAAAMDWYPGDEYVDIIGADIYLPDRAYGSSFMMFDNLVKIFQGQKIIALSENGPIPDPDRLFREHSGWSWFCTWSGEFIMNGTTNEQAHISKVYNHEYVITLDELDDVDQIIAELEKKREEMDDDVVLSVEEDSEGFFSFINPVRNGLLQLTVNSKEKISAMELVDVSGRIDSVANVNADVIEIDFSYRPAGTYILRIHLGSSIKMIRVIKL